jgi:hypothetical protein
MMLTGPQIEAIKSLKSEQKLPLGDSSAQSATIEPPKATPEVAASSVETVKKLAAFVAKVDFSLVKPGSAVFQWNAEANYQIEGYIKLVTIKGKETVNADVWVTTKITKREGNRLDNTFISVTPLLNKDADIIVSAQTIVGQLDSITLLPRAK